MPLPLFIGGAIAVVGAVGLVGARASRRHLRGKSILVVGPSGAGKSSLVQILSHHEVVVRPSHGQRWRDKAARLADFELKVNSIDSPGGEEALDAVRTGAKNADLVCLVTTVQSFENSGAPVSAMRLAKLIGEVAGASTRSALVLSHADTLSEAELESLLRSPTALALQGAIGATVIHPCDLTDHQSWNETAEAILIALKRSKTHDQRNT